MLLNFFRGFCMALADSVPGISGGTIAFILGFYNKFINSLNGIISKNKELRKESIKFFIKLFFGWAVGMISSLIFISSIFEENIYKISSLFIGLIVFSIPVIIISEKRYILGREKNVLFTLISLSIVVLISYVNQNLGSSINILNGDITFPVLLYVFASGAIAISTMILPGISGSTILVILGLYGPMILIIKEVLKFNFTYLYILIIFVIGIVCGILLSVRIIKSLLENYRSQAIYSIIGLMIGSIYTLIHGPESLSRSFTSLNFSNFSITFFIIGGIIILLLEWSTIYLEKSRK